LAGLFTALTAVGAFVRIPLPYVPLTLQTVFVLLAGDLLPPRFAVLSQIAYLLIGLVGLPVFANGGGLGYVLHPTFGYLAAFPLAAWVVAILTRNWVIPKYNVQVHAKESSRTKFDLVRRFVFINCFGILIVLFFGVVYLFANINIIAGGHLSLLHAFWTGMIVFLPGDSLKVLIASMLAVEIRKRVEV